VLGVDDFALRRGHRYGTILIDIETGQSVDMLKDRTAESLAEWLRQRPGVEIICRDRGGSYAEGAARGAPDAVQVADRWHLVHNLSQAVERAVAPLRRFLQPSGNPATPGSDPETVQDLKEDRDPEAPIVGRTRARHAEIHALLDQGLGVYAISRRLNLDPKAVRRFADVADADDLLGPHRVARPSVLDRFKPRLIERCANGVTGTLELLDEIRARGYTGGRRTLRRFLIGVRGEQPPPIQRAATPSTRDITALIMRPGKKLTADEQAQLDRLCQQCDQLATIRNLAHGFTTLVRNRTVKAAQRLDAWVDTATKAGIQQLASFANGLTKDRDAVIAGLSTPWSSGRVEGTVNKIKMLKRQMYGRANPDLLRKRILLVD
jgi:transposase